MAEVVSARIHERSDVTPLIGSGNETMMRDNHRNHARFMGYSLPSLTPSLFLDTVHWVYRTYRARGFSPRYWEVMLPLWQEVMREKLPSDVRESITPFYQWILQNHEALVRLSDEQASTWENPEAVGSLSAGDAD
jgi:hypothetical protein